MPRKPVTEKRGVVAARSKKLRNGVPGKAAIPSGNRGRVLGAPTKRSVSGRESLEEVFDRLGGVAGMVRWAKKNKTDFYTKLWIRLVPRDVTLTPGAGLEEMLSRLAEARNGSAPQSLPAPGDDAQVVDGVIVMRGDS